MPIPNDYREICEKLFVATKAGRVNWNEAGGGTFFVRLPDFVLEIWSGQDENEERFVAFGLKDPTIKARGLYDNWHLEEGDKDYELMMTLCEAARRTARNVPQKLEALKTLLSGDGIIGITNDEKK